MLYNKRYYLLTIRKHQVKDYVGHDDLMTILEQIQVMIPHITVLDLGMEFHGLYLQLHLHAILRVQGKLRYSSYTRIGAYRCHWQEIYKEDLLKIHYYIHKNAHDLYKQEQILDQNYYRSHYGFNE